MSGELGGQSRLVAGRYRLIDELGRGGMGVVWRARDEVLQRDVAVKEVCAPANLEPAEVQRLYSRLEREGWAAARVSHRGVITVYDVATDDDRPWIVMELVRGLSFADVLDAEGPLPPQRAAAVGAEVVGALRAAHESGVLHRDVKPGNILVADDGRVVLTDFGIAVIEGGTNLTATGELIGSPEFLAPERALGRTPGPASDLWSLGVTLYAAMEGFSPFRQDTPLSTMRAVVDEELPPPRRAGPLGPVLDGLMRKDPEERMDARAAETMLRLVAAGGTPRTPTEAVAPGPPGYTPTVHGDSRPPTATAAAGAAMTGTGTVLPGAGTATTSARFAAEAGAGTATGTGTGFGSARRPGRRPGRGLVIAGLVALLLGGGGVAYALLDDDGGGDLDSAREAPAAVTPSDDGAADADGSSSGGSDDGAEEAGAEEAGGGGGDGQDADGAGHAGQQITVHAAVAAERDWYSGTCPPHAGEAPHFNGTISVSGTPAKVTYRWVTDSGQGGSGWKTASFSHETKAYVEHTVLTYADGATHEDAIGIEVKSPRQVHSNSVSFSTTCEETDGGAEDGGGSGGVDPVESPSYAYD